MEAMDDSTERVMELAYHRATNWGLLYAVNPLPWCDLATANHDPFAAIARKTKEQIDWWVVTNHREPLERKKFIEVWTARAIEVGAAFLLPRFLAPASPIRVSLVEHVLQRGRDKHDKLRRYLKGEKEYGLPQDNPFMTLHSVVMWSDIVYAKVNAGEPCDFHFL